MICPFKEVWFKTDSLTQRVGIVLGWVYDIWYEVKEKDTNKIFWVYPEHLKPIVK